MKKDEVRTSENRKLKRLSSLFWDYEFESLKKNLSSPFVIARVLEMSTPEEFEIFSSIIGDDEIVEFLGQKGERMLSKRAFAFWKLYYEKKVKKTHKKIHYLLGFSDGG